MRARHRRAPIAERDDQMYGSVVLVPARNEEDGLLAGLESIARQVAPPDLIIVIVNNSNDDTEKIARNFSYRSDVPTTHVLVMHGNIHKKAGALNEGIRHLQALARRPLAGASRYLLVMDADTELHPSFMVRAQRVITNNPALGGVSAACLGRHVKPGSLWQRYLLGMQRIEYGRYSVTRMMHSVFTMSGAGSYYRTDALQSLIDWRGEVFWEHEANLVEDFETTLALKESGWQVTANQWCTAYTDLMPTLRDLSKQRDRWVRGAVDTLRVRGITRHTWRPIGSLVVGLAGVAFTVALATFYSYSIWRHGYSPGPAYYWIAASWYPLYQAYTVRRLGWRSVVTELLVLPELFLSFFRMYWLTASVVKSYLTHRRPSAWA